jgi:pimeloyl-ACP methyl ester carboxylesterase
MLVLAACRQHDEAAGAADDPSPHSERFVVSAGARLHLLDWGGSGEPVILIPGGGDNPHAFDEIGPALATQFRVVAYARRAHGESDALPPFDIETLVSDLATVADTLGFATVNLVGWSLAGHEMTRFAGRYPHRVRRLVYLDAAYEWGDPAWNSHIAALQAIQWQPPRDGLVNRAAFRGWLARQWFPGIRWTSALSAYADHLVRERPDGTLQFLASDSVLNPVFAALASYRRDYSAVTAPALAVFAPQYVPFEAADSVLGPPRAEWTAQHWRPWQDATRRRWEAEVRNGSTLMLPRGAHMAFVFTERDTLISAIRAFLTTQ